MAVKMNSFILSLLLVVALAIGAASSPANEVEIAPPNYNEGRERIFDFRDFDCNRIKPFRGH